MITTKEGLIINTHITKEQFDSAVAAGTITDNQLSFVVDEEASGGGIPILGSVDLSSETLEEDFNNLLITLVDKIATIDVFSGENFIHSLLVSLIMVEEISYYFLSRLESTRALFLRGLNIHSVYSDWVGSNKNTYLVTPADRDSLSDAVDSSLSSIWYKNVFPVSDLDILLLHGNMMASIIPGFVGAMYSLVGDDDEVLKTPICFTGTQAEYDLFSDEGKEAIDIAMIVEDE